MGLTYSSVHDDPAVELAADALSELLRRRQFERYQTWLRTRRSYPPAWREAATDSEHLIWLTAEELAELTSRLNAELGNVHRERLTDPTLRPDGAVPVELLTLGYPVQLPPA